MPCNTTFHWCHLARNHLFANEDVDERRMGHSRAAWWVEELARVLACVLGGRLEKNWALLTEKEIRTVLRKEWKMERQLVFWTVEH